MWPKWLDIFQKVGEKTKIFKIIFLIWFVIFAFKEKILNFPQKVKSNKILKFDNLLYFTLNVSNMFHFQSKSRRTIKIEILSQIQIKN